LPEIGGTEGLSRKGQGGDRQGQDEPLCEEDHNAPVVVLGVLGVAGKSPVPVRAADGSSTLAVKAPVKFRAGGENREDKDEGNRQQRGCPQEQ
jgi:hypothetical protein